MTTIPDEVPASQSVILGQIRALLAMLKDFSFNRPEVRSGLNIRASISDRLLEAVAVALDATPALAAVIDMNPAELRDVISYTQTLRPVAEELKELARGIEYSIAVKRAKAGARALHAYSLSKKLNAPTDSAVIVPHIAAMKAALGPRGRRKAAPKADPTTDPATTPVAAKFKAGKDL
jgi:hypothetical protein